MQKTDFLALLKAVYIEPQADNLISSYTGFRVGGPADFVVKPNTITEFLTVIEAALSCGLSYCFLGNGSNVLACDEGYRGVLILTSGFDKSELDSSDKELIHCQSGASMSSLCCFAQKNALSGLEFAYGIPGTVGGCVYMNAGAYGGEIKDAIISCQFIDKQGKLSKLYNKELDFSYRHSFFTDKELFILSADFKLKKNDEAIIKSTMEDFMGRRREKQPLEFPSCGSTFKRPKNGFASALIDECGLKGCTIGGAQVSQKHAGFIINKGDATCSDILALIEHVQSVVMEKKGIFLECEVRRL